MDDFNEIETFETDEPFFTQELGRDIAKAFAITAASTAGMIVGAIATTAAVQWWKNRNAAPEVATAETPAETPNE